jgi:predicted transcriptional regulator
MPEEYGDNFGNEDRQKVLDVVSEAPGLNMWEIQKRLGQPLETVEPILNFLEQDGLLIVKEEGGFRRFYLHEEKPGEEKVEHTLLRKKVEQETGESFELEARKKVFDIIAEAPGLHLREIQKRLNIPLGTVEYHLNYFEDNETVLVKEEGGYKRYYPKQAMGSEDRKLLSLLRQAIPRRIVLFLMHKPRSSSPRTYLRGSRRAGSHTSRSRNLNAPQRYLSPTNGPSSTNWSTGSWALGPSITLKMHLLRGSKKV